MTTYPDAPASLVQRWQKRRVRMELGPGEGFDPDVDLARLADTPLQDDPWEESLSPHAVKSRAIRLEFSEVGGATELHQLNALLIAHLRKRRFPPEVLPLFRRVWSEQGERLRRELSSRWLISTLITFADHGATEAERRLGLGFNILFSLMKLYEHERLRSGFDASQPFRRRVTGTLPLDMPPFALRAGGLDINLLAPLWLEAETVPLAGPVALELLERLNEDPRGIFARLAALRGAENGTET